jgi:hypothetical protein
MDQLGSHALLEARERSTDRSLANAESLRGLFFGHREEELNPIFAFAADVRVGHFYTSIA